MCRWLEHVIIPMMARQWLPPITLTSIIHYALPVGSLRPSLYGNTSLGVLHRLVRNVNYARPILFFWGQYLTKCVVIVLDKLLIDFPVSSINFAGMIICLSLHVHTTFLHILKV